MKKDKFGLGTIQSGGIESKKVNPPRIFFGYSQEGYYSDIKSATDFIQCPTLKQVRDRSNMSLEHALVSQNFQQSILNATQKIWILDNYLHKNMKESSVFDSILKLIEINTQILDVRFYLRSKTNEDDINELINYYNELIRDGRKSHQGTKIECGFFDDLNFIHDRFAIIDNNLWHFGSDVGASNQSLHATSYGWNSEQLKITNFFEELWEERNE